MKKKLMTTVLGFVVLCVIGWLILGIMSCLESKAWGAEDEASAGIKTGDYHWIAPTGVSYGNPNAPVIIVEYSDFVNPICAIASGNLLEAVRESNGKAMVILKLFPQPYYGERAKRTAYAVVAAGRQGKFWAMAEKLFAQKALLEEDIQNFASELGLDLKKFNEDLNATTTVAEVDNDFKEGVDIGVPAAPTFFFNGRAYVGAATKEKFLSLIAQAEEELKKTSSCGVGGACADGDTADGDLTPDGDLTTDGETTDGDVIEMTEEVMDGDVDSEVEEISATEVANFFLPGVSTVINVANKIATVDGDIDAQSQEAISESADGDRDLESEADGDLTTAGDAVDGDVIETTAEVVDGDYEIGTPFAEAAKEALNLNIATTTPEPEPEPEDKTQVEKESLEKTKVVGSFSFTGFALGEENFNPTTDENFKVLQEIRKACEPECYVELLGSADKTEIRSAGKILQANAQTVLALRRANTVRLFLFSSQLPAVSYTPIGEWGEKREVRVFVRKPSSPPTIMNGNFNNVSGQGNFPVVQSTQPPAPTAPALQDSLTQLVVKHERGKIFGVGAMVMGRCGFTGCNAGGGVQMDFFLTERLTLRLEGSLSAPFIDRPKGNYKPNSPSHQLGFGVGSELTYQPRKWLEVGGGFAFTEGYAFPGAKFAKWNATWREWELTLPIYFQVWERDGQTLSLFVRPALGVSIWGEDSRLFLATPSGTIGLAWRFGKW